MAKIPYRTLTHEKRTALQEELTRTFLRLPRKEEIVQLLSALLTPSEQVMLARRIQVAKLLLAGKSQIEIRSALHVGFPLIQSVERWLESTVALPRETLSLPTEKDRSTTKKKRRDFDDPNSFTGLRRRYPGRMGIINFLLDEN